jgi:GNAT superfamily N-acetyltransferase
MTNTIIHNNLTIRPAQASDRDAVFTFTEGVWNGEDYIRYVWEEWLAETDDPPFVATIDEQPIALVKLSNLGDGEGWIHGVRVAEEFRGRGIARALLRYCVERSQQRGARIVRLMTSEENRAMRTTAEAVGFRMVSAATWFTGPAAATHWRLAPLPTSAYDRIRNNFVTIKPQLYCVGWRYRALTAERLREHLEAGEILGLPETDAWAIVVPDDTIWVGAAYGEPDALTELLRAIPAHPARTSDSAVRALTPSTSPFAETLSMAGYRAGTSGERCYEVTR